MQRREVLSFPFYTMQFIIIQKIEIRNKNAKISRKKDEKLWN